MIESVMSSEIWTLLVALLPSLASIGASVLAAILAIKKVVQCITEFRSSNELKENTETVNKLLQDNEQLKKLNEKLLVELTRIKPLSWTDDAGGK